MRILTPARERIEDQLALGLGKLFPPKSTRFRTICMDCNTLVGVQRIPYREEYGPETTSHGLCVDCAAMRGVLGADHD